jgi:long-chain acyl-CoA synthetase
MFPGDYAKLHGEKNAVTMAGSGESITYAELDQRSRCLADVFRTNGLRVGDCVTIFAENHIRFFEVWWAAMRSGLYLTPISRLASASEAAYIVNDSGAKAIITTNQLSDVAFEIADDLAAVSLRLMIDGSGPGYESYEAACAAVGGVETALQPRGELMAYSSGTTGRPKGVRRPLSGLDVRDPRIQGTSGLRRQLFGMGEDSVYLCPVPLYHAAGCVWSAGVHELGGSVVVMERFSPEGFLDTIERQRVTHTQVVPTMMVRLMKLPDEMRAGFDLSSLRRIVHAAAPCPVEVKRGVIDWLGPIVDEYYSSTEGAGFTYISAAEWLAHPGSVGKPLAGRPMVCDAEGHELPDGETGVVYFQQTSGSFEYLNDPEKTAGTRHPRRADWVTVGDLGYVDEAGYLYLTDRLSFTIISGGVNIYPAEIESELVSHPSVADAGVFGLPDAEMGEFVFAVIEPVEGVEQSADLAEELRSYLRQRLAGYKVPRRIEFKTKLPRLPTGKLVKGDLRKEYLERGTLT